MLVQLQRGKKYSVSISTRFETTAKKIKADLAKVGFEEITVKGKDRRTAEGTWQGDVENVLLPEIVKSIALL